MAFDIIHIFRYDAIGVFFIHERFITIALSLHDIPKRL